MNTQIAQAVAAAITKGVVGATCAALALAPVAVVRVEIPCERSRAICGPLVPDSPHAPDRHPSQPVASLPVPMGTATGSGTNTGSVPPFTNNSMTTQQVDAAHYQPGSMVYGTPPVMLRTSAWD